MVGEAEFMLLNRPYIGNFDLTSEWSGNDRHFSKKFYTWAKYFKLGRRVQRLKKLNEFVQFEKWSKVIGWATFLFCPPAGAYVKDSYGEGLVLFFVWPFFQICDAVWKNGYLEKLPRNMRQKRNICA